ncbi:hypothetical protein FOZ62_011253, partial [Perkinsus olseni]
SILILMSSSAAIIDRPVGRRSGVPAWTNGGYNHRPLDNAGYSTSSTLVVPSCIYGHAKVNDNYVKQAEGRLWRRDLPWESSGWAHDSTTRAMMLFNNTDIRPYTSPSLATLYQLDMSRINRPDVVIEKLYGGECRPRRRERKAYHSS